MSESARYFVALFPSTSDALRAEKALKHQGIPNKLIPVPRHLSSDCGVSLRFKREDFDAAEAAFTASGIRVEGIFPLEEERS